jgi:hypothetical protein
MILLPDSDSAVSSDWILGGSSAEGTVHDSLDDNNGDNSFVACDDHLETMIIGYANPSVAEGDITSIDSVRFLSSGRSTDRRNASSVIISFQTPSGFAETCSYDAHASSYEAISGIVREEKPSSGGDWIYPDIEALEMICTKFGAQNIQLSYLALRVDYTEAVTTNATFFGANF